MGHTGQKELRKQTDPLYALRHSAAHIMAQAVRRLHPESKLAIGPPIEDGFYYDLELPAALTEESLGAIEAEMRKIVEEDHPFVRSSMSKDEALAFFRERNERYKLEIIEGIPDASVSLYTDGEFVDLCEGPHVASTGQVRAFKLLSLAGAYWRGDERRPQLQRVYGTAFLTQEDLDRHLHRLEEAKRRDHRKLGTALELFSIEEAAGPGLIFWHPKGALVRTLMEDWLRRELLARGYDLVYTPHIMREELWQTSGHTSFYRDNMFAPIEVETAQYQLKPMNCPGHILIYKSRLRSYRELPVRLAELGTVYRYERSGVLHGLMRVRGFTQDDAHIFCRPDHIEAEVEGCIRFAWETLRAFGFDDYVVELSDWDEGEAAHYAGNPEDWRRATDALTSTLERLKVPYTLMKGEAAFYGPKIDVKLIDAIGRAWQLTTVQFDFNLPARFNLEYIDEEGKPQRPLMVHRALWGSVERFFGVLLEHYAGALPAWLAPVQVAVIPVSEAVHGYARAIAEALRARGLRASVDERNERMQAKIRDAQLQQVPYMAVVGKREAEAGTVAVRHRREGDLGAMAAADLASRVIEDKHEVDHTD
ncbi:MAG TPA: threonine--tRNA ligase [bacterium]